MHLGAGLLVLGRVWQRLARAGALRDQPVVFRSPVLREIEDVLPQMLASLGVLFAAAGIGDAIGSLTRIIIPDGSIFLEGVGVEPTARVPVNEETVLASQDPVLIWAVAN